jgi:hypothetical protein
MNSQNILKFYGSKLDLKLDSSELYDFEMVGVGNDYDIGLLDFTTGGTITYDSLVVDSDCLNLTPISSLSPWTINIGEPYTGQTCDFTVRKRTESGWTLDFVFSGNTGVNNTFYSWGTQSAIVDNYLRFYFASNRSIAWEVTRYSGYCNTVSGYTETTYVDTDSIANWNVDSIFDYYDVRKSEFLDSGQLVGGIFIIRRCEHTINIVNKWYEGCCNYHLIDDSPSNITNDESFIENRHDQSIFSIIRKKYGTEMTETDETYFGADWNTSGYDFPFWAKRLRE